MDKSRLTEILENFKNVSVGVIGDFSLDAYWLLDTNPPELSLETGKPTNAVLQQRYSLGAAGNVVNNLVGLGVGKIAVFGVISNDLFGRELLLQLEDQKVDTNGLIIQRNDWDTPVYAKPYYGMEEQNRIDFGRFNKISTDIENKIIYKLNQAITHLDVLIVNQQIRNGIYSPKVVSVLNSLAAEHPNKIFLLESRNRSDEFFNMVCKFRASEAAEMCGEEKEINESISIDDLNRYAKEIIAKPQKALYITRSMRGILIFDGQDFISIPGVQILKKIDAVGAGDTVVASIAAVLAAGGTYDEAGVISNLAASITIQKLQQTGVATPDEIFDMWENADYVYRPELANDFRQAKIIDNTDIEIVTQGISLDRIEHAIFDHDGTISTLREGWENIMEPVMVRAILGNIYQTVEEEVYHRVTNRVRNYIDQSKGIDTYNQMQTLIEMVNEFGIVSKEDILSPEGYKQNYYEALMKMVNGRLERIRSGELSVSDFTLKGVIDFLKYLYDRGVKLYLASGNEYEDVVREAESLGYAHLFEGRIYGFIKDKIKNKKQAVVKSIINKNNLRGPQFACFGDGPIELRETKKMGGIAIGVASNEIRRYGLDLIKRERLIRAGADIIIPDFSQNNRFIELLFNED